MREADIQVDPFEGEGEGKPRAITNSTLDYQRNQKVCLNCGHTRGVHYGNTPYRVSEVENHCARCITSRTTCRGFYQPNKLPTFQAYLGVREVEWPLRLWENEIHAKGFLKAEPNKYPHVYRVRVEAISEMELVQEREYLVEKGGENDD